MGNNKFHVNWDVINHEQNSKSLIFKEKEEYYEQYNQQQHKNKTIGNKNSMNKKTSHTGNQNRDSSIK